jgi:hypothetical protein
MRNTVIRLAVLAFAAVGLSACIVAPGPYGGGYHGHRHGGYYAAPAPRYYRGGGYGRGHRGW